MWGWGRVVVGLAVTGVAATILGWASPASATAAYGPVVCSESASISPSTVAPGGSFTLSLTGGCANDTFTVVLHSSPVTLGTITTNASGSGSAGFSVPANTAGGDHTVTAADASGNSASVAIVITAAATAVTAAPAAAAKHPLPFTGAQIAGLVAAGAVAIGLGGLLVLVTRRRKARFS
jgi:hypothetical protein